MNAKEIRDSLTLAQRVVVKVGTRVLVDKSGRPNQRRIDALARDLAALHRKGADVVLVSSGAVGAGMEALGMKIRPKTLPELQMAAAVGQARLMSRYEEPFSREHCQIGQILLTYSDLNNRERHLNIKNTMNELFRRRIIPIVNENDVVSVNEIKVGDNDVLAALSAIMINADLLILLSTTNGLKATDAAGVQHTVSYLPRVTSDVLQHVNGKGSELSTGGMESKLMAAQKAVETGIPVVIADGRKTGIVMDIVDGKKKGTLLAADQPGGRRISSKKRWIAYFHRAQGSVTVDAGARNALVHKGRSLLPIGIRQLTGHFPMGSLINIKDENGIVFAKGLTDFSREELELIMGHQTSEIADLLNECHYSEVIHRDNMVVLEDV